jgi:hypothetical protein
MENEINEQPIINEKLKKKQDFMAKIFFSFVAFAIIYNLINWIFFQDGLNYVFGAAFFAAISAYWILKILFFLAIILICIALLAIAYFIIRIFLELLIRL